MKTFTGRVAAMTGAGSGIGRALVVQLAELGCVVAIADKNVEGLVDTRELVAAIIIRGVRKKRRRVLIGDDAKFSDLIVRLFPGSHEKRLKLERS